VASAVLTLNAGSSSIKFALFEVGPSPRRIAGGAVDGIGTAPNFHAFDASGAVLADQSWPGKTHEDFLSRLLDWTGGHLGNNRLAAAGHRIVHGGGDFIAPTRLDAATIAALDQLSPLAPLHQPHNLNAVRAVAKLRPDLPQVGCFDTAFHHSMTATARRFALPRELETGGVRRYGFHGLSYEFIAGRLKDIAPVEAGGRIIIAHLGNGASLCALEGGLSRDTTMGLTALDGLMMGTRCGDLDPGVLLYLMQSRGMDAAALEDMLYRKAGLLGVSGISADVRALLASADPHAAEAIDLFVFRIAREMGAMAATLGGVDGLVFTAGIGENAVDIRRRICARAAWLGVSIDAAANQANASRISTPDSLVSVWVLPTDEEVMIARHTMATLA
jgi:acetate kinase